MNERNGTRRKGDVWEDIRMAMVAGNLFMKSRPPAKMGMNRAGAPRNLTF
jgi:hypothetical protein